jgi:hypothetical protein
VQRKLQPVRFPLLIVVVAEKSSAVKNYDLPAQQRWTGREEAAATSTVVVSRVEAPPARTMTRRSSIGTTTKATAATTAAHTTWTTEVETGSKTTAARVRSVTELNTGTVKETRIDVTALSALAGPTPMTAGAITATTDGAKAGHRSSMLDCRTGAEITNGSAMNGALAAGTQLAVTVMNTPRATACPPHQAVTRERALPMTRRRLTTERDARLHA